MPDRYVVKRRRNFGGVEVTSVISLPIPKEAARQYLADLNDEYQYPGNYYIEKWEEKA